VAESILMAQRVAETLRDEPSYGAQWWRVTCGEIAGDLCGRMLSRVDFSDEQLVRLATAFQSIPMEDGILRPLIGDRVWGIELYRDSSGLVEVVDALPAFWSRYPSAMAWNRHADLALYLEMMGNAIAVARQPLADIRRDMPAVSNAVNQTVEGLGLIRYPIAALMLPNFDDSVNTLTRGSAMNDVTATALWIELYRRRHGRLPDDLQDLVPELMAAVPVDPFSGGPLRYVVHEGGYKIYSVGVDGLDHGGQPPADDVPYYQTDLVIEAGPR
jgi:hypothetical protein